MSQACFLRVALPVPLRRLFDYRLPRNLPSHGLRPGMRVQVPFGKRKLIGILASTTTKPELAEDKLKSALQVLDEEPVLQPDILALCEWASRYYHAPLGELFSLAIPATLRQGKPLSTRHRLWRLRPAAADAAEALLSRAPKQKQAWHFLSEHPKGLSEDSLKAFGFATSILSQLEQKGLVEHAEVEEHSTHFEAVDPILKCAPLTLNDEQQHALAAITEETSGFRPALLDGITGSGKTEVYLQAIDHCLQQGQQALVLVPEIGLTPQTINRFHERFNVPVVTLHSGLNDTERHNAWRQGLKEEAGILIGTRSAIFAPLPKLGLIIVDEEHDLSYKQQDSIRYSARDLAVYRARLKGIPVILGSATPSLETYNNASQHRYLHLRLTQRAGNARAPAIELLNIRDAALQDGLSEALLEQIKTHLDQSHQVLVFINRRGFSPTLMCYSCGSVMDCPGCDAHMTLHRNPWKLHCHHCDTRRPVPSSCPDCHSSNLQAVGEGTEKIEETLQQLFPKTPVFRIDRDSTRNRNAMEKILAQVHSTKACIMLGTQMLAKGHHFPRVTLAAMLNMDAGLYSSDYRALERTGQLLTQVAGRSGRADKPGKVVIQTRDQENIALQQLANGSYQEFIPLLLQERQLMQLPPFSFQALIRTEAATPAEGERFLSLIRTILEQQASQLNLNGPEGLQLLGPWPAPMERRQGRYRQQLLLQSVSRQPLHTILNFSLSSIESLPESRKVRWSVDIDPQDMS
ncbi:primosomal protein N' [Spongorhabdus nitratireducens]